MTRCATTRHLHARAHELVPDASFHDAFGATKAEAADALIASKTVTIPLLLRLLPPDTSDPSPLLYDDAFYLAGFSTLAWPARRCFSDRGAPDDQIIEWSTLDVRVCGEGGVQLARRRARAEARVPCSCTVCANLKRRVVTVDRVLKNACSH